MERHDPGSPCEWVTEDDQMRCPYCHETNDDADLRGANSGFTECSACGKPFDYEADYTIHWTTAPRGDAQ
jgi:DNA-directed RNA polymerase subunit RPC12/RpoP